MVKTTLAPLALIAVLCCCGCFSQPPDPHQARFDALESELFSLSGRPPIPETLTLNDAVAYALRNNLNIRAAELDILVKSEDKVAEALRMLPSLTAGVNESYRNHYNASTSEHWPSGNQYLNPSYSTDKESFAANLTLAWSVLDFGLARLRATQAGEKEQVAWQDLRRLRQRIAMETMVAYYRVVASEAAARNHRPLLDTINLQRDIVKDEAQRRNISKGDEARRVMPLLTGRRSIQEIGRERQSALIALARAMGAGDVAGITVAIPENWGRNFPYVPDDDEELIRMALGNRPEMFSADSEQRISETEVKAAMLRFAPNVNLSATLTHDENRFLIFHNWMEAAARVSWDLLRIPQRIREAKSAETKAELAEHKRLVAAASVAMQVKLAAMEYREAVLQVELVGEIEENRRTLMHIAEDAVASGQGSLGQALDEQVRHAMEYWAVCRAQSECMAAYARLMTALGRDPFGSDAPALPPADLAVAE